MDFSADRPAFFVNPDYRPMTGAKKQVIDPATLETVGTISAATDGEIDAALTAATTAQAAWKNSTPRAGQNTCMQSPMPSRRPTSPDAPN